MAELVNTRSASPTVSSNPYSTVNNVKIPIERNHDPNIIYMVTPLCNSTKFITVVHIENVFIIHAHGTMINKDQERNEGLESS